MIFSREQIGEIDILVHYNLETTQQGIKYIQAQAKNMSKRSDAYSKKAWSHKSTVAISPTLAAMPPNTHKHLYSC
jgi:hypothetical protein